VLIVGESGIGKSECALDLVVRGHRLVADDTVEVRRRAASIIIGSCPELTRHHMEVRGLGLINIRDLFGVASTRTSKRVELVVQLERWDPHREYDRLRLDDEFYDLLGLRVPLLRMPVAPGRNLAILVEVAARNQLLRSRGINAARELAAKLDAQLREHRSVPLAGPDEDEDLDHGGHIGMSGGGKTHAIRALEDLGYYCVDNLPTPLMPVLADLARHESSDNPKVAAVIDVRERRFVTEFPKVWRKLKSTPGLHPLLVFLDASEAALLRRYSETRRPHPLAPRRPIAEALKEERQMLAPIRAMADEIIDTSEMNVHELREAFHNLVRGDRDRRTLVLTFESFGYKHGVPLDADLVFDCRFLPNPHFVSGLRTKTGRDRAVAAYMERHTETRDLAQRLSALLKYLVPRYVNEGKAYLTVAIGCTGGRHRSVYLAELLKREFGTLKNVTARVRHRDLVRES
jgi:UPF0042 nucleotide-binding protein